MKKIFNIFSIICLIIISFVYTEKSMMVVREYDDIMIRIKEQKNISEIKSIIIDDKIRPGVLEKKINIQKSYKEMKEYGSFNKKLLVYDVKDNKESLDNNLDKYIIGGNKNKQMISLIFKLNWNSDIDKLIEILDKNNIKGNILINSNWINKDIINKIANNDHILISNDIKINKIIKNVFSQKKQYCYGYDKEVLKKCSKEKYYTILPIEINDNILIKTRNNLESGNFLSFEVSDNLINELENIINSIKNKGFKITNLIEHLSE